MTDKTRIRDAATVVIVRRDGSGDPAGDTGPAPRVLMGQRGDKAAFMPSKFVFPGGALDPEDATLAEAIAGAPSHELTLRLAAIRETWEETGLALGTPGPAPVDDPAAFGPSWAGFMEAGFVPDTARVEFFFRAITPPGRPRRFDARFFLVDAASVATDPDDFSRAEEELSHLSWIGLDEARALDLPFVTDVVLAEVAAHLAEPEAHRPVPFFHHADGRSFLTAS